MRGTIVLFVTLAVGFGAGHSATWGQEPEAAPSSAEISDLDWLAGRWQGSVSGVPGANRFEAQYTTAEGGVVLGVSKAFSEAGDLLWTEFEKFAVRDGVITVTPYPNGKQSVSFKLVRYDESAKKAVFSNPEHDFPTEISYQRVSEDRVQFIASGETKNGRSALQFDLTRQP